MKTAEIKQFPNNFWIALLVITLLLISYVTWGQVRPGNFSKINMTEKLHSGQYDLIKPGDSIGQWVYMRGADPTNNLDLVNLRTLRREIAANLDTIIVIGLDTIIVPKPDSLFNSFTEEWLFSGDAIIFPEAGTNDSLYFSTQETTISPNGWYGGGDAFQFGDQKYQEFGRFTRGVLRKRTTGIIDTLQLFDPLDYLDPTDLNPVRWLPNKIIVKGDSNQFVWRGTVILDSTITGFGLDVSRGAFDNVVLIGHGATADKDSQLVLGGSDIAEVSTVGYYDGTGYRMNGDSIYLWHLLNLAPEDSGKYPRHTGTGVVWSDADVRVDSVFTEILRSDTIYSVVATVDTIYNFELITKTIRTEVTNTDTIYSIVSTIDTIYNETIITNNVTTEIFTSDTVYLQTIVINDIEFDLDLTTANNGDGLVYLEGTWYPTAPVDERVKVVNMDTGELSAAGVMSGDDFIIEEVGGSVDDWVIKLNPSVAKISTDTVTSTTGRVVVPIIESDTIMGTGTGVRRVVIPNIESDTIKGSGGDDSSVYIRRSRLPNLSSETINTDSLYTWYWQANNGRVTGGFFLDSAHIWAMYVDTIQARTGEGNGEVYIERIRIRGASADTLTVDEVNGGRGGFEYLETEIMKSAKIETDSVFVNDVAINLKSDSLYHEHNSTWLKNSDTIKKELPSGVNGDILYYNSGWQKLPKGIDGQVLTMVGGLPSWEYLPIECDTGEIIGGVCYPTVVVGTQTWMAVNLDIDDGGGGIYAYNDDEGNVATYGRLYTWDAAVRVASDIEGWRLPTLTEMLLLASQMGGELTDQTDYKEYDTGAYELRVIGTDFWDNANGLDSFGFALLGVGERFLNGTYRAIGNRSQLWSSTLFDGSNAWNLEIGADWEGIAFYYNHTNEISHCVRLIKDTP